MNNWSIVGGQNLIAITTRMRQSLFAKETDLDLKVTLWRLLSLLRPAASYPLALSLPLTEQAECLNLRLKYRIRRCLSPEAFRLDVRPNKRGAQGRLGTPRGRGRLSPSWLCLSFPLDTKGESYCQRTLSIKDVLSRYR